MTPCTLPAVVSALAAAIAKDKTQTELAVLAALFSQLGDSLALIAAAQECCQTTEINA